MLLSITIPTYNRATLLRRCLNSVLPQIVDHESVEVVVIDNASPDHTREVVGEFLRSNPRLRYFRNTENLGYAGNQAKCFEHARGKYAAILCDDDVYRDDAIATMLPILGAREYSFVALNYFGFSSDPGKPHIAEITRQEDLFAENAYDILEHPGVGHFSGFVFNVALARQSVEEILARHPLSFYERFRGIFGEVAIRSMKSSALPGYFIGKTIVGAGVPPTIDYDSLRHVCMDYYELFLRYHDEGLLNAKELEFRRYLVLSWLPKALLRNGAFLNETERVGIARQLHKWFDGDARFERRSAPILHWLDHVWFRLTLRMGVRIFKIAQRARIRMLK